jgi:hypothetical protein
MNQPPFMYAVDPRRTSGMAVASMVLGIVGLATGCCSFGIFSIVAVVLGHVALKETRTNTVKGHGMAVAGLVMGYILAGPSVLVSVLWIFGSLFGGLAGVVAPTATPSY